MLQHKFASPYDLGDRIFFTSPETAENPGQSVSWFVEGK